MPETIAPAVIPAAPVLAPDAPPEIAPEEAVPRTDAPARASGPDAADQATTGLAALARLATATLPAHPVRWVPHWDEAAAVVVSGPAQLASCMAMLGYDEFGGVKLDDSTGPWVQVLKAVDDEDFLVELHPHERSDRDLPLLFERIVGLSPADAAELAWSWVRGKGVPAGLEREIELRTVPDGSPFDAPL